MSVSTRDNVDAIRRLTRGDEMKETKWLNETQAAEFIGISKVTLQNWRNDGRAPRHYRYESESRPAIRYKKSELMKWRESHAVEPD